jgi:hypothetical protein
MNAGGIKSLRFEVIMAEMKDRQPIIIEIIIKGSISSQMEEWFEGMSVFSGENSSSIRGTLPDQQALYGLVNLLRDLGVSILSIKMGPKDE